MKKLMITMLIVLSLVNFIQAMDFKLNESDGAVTGTGGTPTHDFPIKISEFNVTISEIQPGGYRTIEVIIPVEKITTENSRRDDHMFTDVLLKDKYPEIHYVATTDFIYPNEGEFVLQGVLKIHDVERKLDIQGTISRESQSWVAKADFSILLSDFSLSRPGFGPMKVKDQVDMSVYLKTDLPVE
jgi:polyisoprenoid-binding protein YceI